MAWKNHLEKNPIQKIEEIVKIEVKLPHVNKNSLARQRIFVPTPFSHYFKFTATKFRAATKKLAPLRVKNDVTHLLQLKLHERMNKC